MNTTQKERFEALINDDPEIKKLTARGAICRIELLATTDDTPENIRLRDERDEINAEINRRKDAHEQTVLNS